MAFLSGMAGLLTTWRMSTFLYGTLVMLGSVEALPHSTVSPSLESYTQLALPSLLALPTPLALPKSNSSEGILGKSRSVFTSPSHPMLANAISFCAY